MNFIKKNIILFSVLVVALIVSGVFIYLVIVETGDMNNAIIEVEAIKNKIDELNKQTPIPNKENYERITADTQLIKSKTKDLEQYFGKPYKKALQALIRELDMKEEEFISLWKETYKKEIKEKSPRNLIYNRFFAQFDKEKSDKAINAFKEQVNAESLEPLNDANIDGCIMEALGLPRKMEPIPCKRYLIEMEEILRTAMKQEPCQSCGKMINMEDIREGKCLKCGKDPGNIAFFEFNKGTEKLTFDKFDGASLPRPDEVSYIFKHLKLLEDLLLRIKMSGIRELNSIRKEDLKGKKKSGFMEFVYTIKVTGSLNNIRNLMNNLLEGYRENRIYIVKSIDLEAKESAKNIVSGKTKPVPRKRRRSLRRDKKETENKEEENEEKAGIPIIGINDTVTAELKFKYIIYIGDELAEND